MNALIIATAAAFGAIVGSFIATLCLRWPKGEQALSGRSRCDGCGRALAPLELVPIVSGLATGGRCRSCGAPIDRLHLGVEVAAALLAATALAIEPNAKGMALAGLWLLLLAPAILDARHYWLPDSLTLSIAFVGLLLGGIATGATLTDRLIGGGAGAAILAIIAIAYKKSRGREGLGTGDPKLLGSIGLWAGWTALAPILSIAAVGGLAVALAQGRSRSQQMPFGTFLAAATILWTGVNAVSGRPLL